MASKETLKKHGRNIYFRDHTLWSRLQAVAFEKNWSLNQVIEIALLKKYPKEQ
jgi:hypothetical protein